MTTEELITAQFYAWEKRGRGWQLWNYPVELEPPFEAFPGYYLPTADDGRKPTALSSFFEKLHGKQSLQEPETDIKALLDCYDQAEPALFFDESPLKEIQIVLPTKSNINREVAERFLSSLRSAELPVGFEIIGLSDAILMQLVCREKDLSLLHSNLRAYFHDSRFQETNNFLINNWSQLADAGNAPVIVDFGLSHEFVIPLQTTSSPSIDTLTGIVGALADVNDGELALLQVLFHATQYEWANSALWATTDYAGRSVFANAPEMAEHLKHKISQPLFATVLRVAAIGNSESRSWDLVKRLGTALTSVFTSSTYANGNELIPLSNDGYDDLPHEEDLLLRQTRRSGIILNNAELLSLVHIPSASLRSEKFKNETRVTKAAPVVAIHAPSKNIVALGENIHEGKAQPVTLSNEQRSKHIHVVGSTGSGKSTFLLSLIKQDLELGNGLCVLDPHGDLIDEVIANVPEDRTDDVILFDPSDAEYPIGFNILQANSELEKTLLSSDLVATFRRMSTSWGDVMDSVLANTILAFVESTSGGTLFELKRFLVEKAFRNEFLQTVADESIRYFWLNEFPLIGGKAQSSILIRLDAFLRQKLVRNIVCQKQTKLDFRKVMDGRKVLLIKLSQGLIGEENAYLLGTLLISKLYQTALSRQDSPERPFFACYLDEFHHFITPSMENVLSGVRKYNLGLVLAHQEFRQLQSRSQDVANSILSNCYTRVCFRLGDADAEKFAGGFSSFDAKALQSVGVGEAVARIERSEYDFNLKTPLPDRVAAEISERKRKVIIDRTRREYAMKKVEVKTGIVAQLPASNAVTPTIEPTGLPQMPPKGEIAASLENTSPVVEGSYRGKGGQHHKELQALIQRVAESYDFEVTIEKSVLDGSGSIDVSLERESLKIACEVSVTSSTDYETKNILKCLTAGYDYALVIVSNQKKLRSLNTKLRSVIPLGQHDKVKAFSIAGLLGFLRDLTVSIDPITRKREKPAGQRLNFAEACEFFDVNSSTLYRWVRQGRVPCYRPGREYQFDREELVLIGRHDLSGKLKPSVILSPIKIEKPKSKGKKRQDDRYRKMLNLD
jgi:excisionase family DNA binding protein